MSLSPVPKGTLLSAPETPSTGLGPKPSPPESRGANAVLIYVVAQGEFAPQRQGDHRRIAQQAPAQAQFQIGQTRADFVGEYAGYGGIENVAFEHLHLSILVHQALIGQGGH